MPVPSDNIEVPVNFFVSAKKPKVTFIGYPGADRLSHASTVMVDVSNRITVIAGSENGQDEGAAAKAFGS